MSFPAGSEQFTGTPSAHQAFFDLNRDLRSTLRSRVGEIPRLRRFACPVRIVFGASDPYLNKQVARRFHELLPTSELFLLPGARHFVHMDEAEQVARLILTVPGQAVAEPGVHDGAEEPSSGPVEPDTGGLA
jgi:haloalkane dehalogenase